MSSPIIVPAEDPVELPLNIPLDLEPVSPWYPLVSPPLLPQLPWTGHLYRQRCAYDGLPPGSYLLVCTCPLHSVYCGL